MAHCYLLLNKPYEVLTQFTDAAGRRTLKDFVPVPNVYPVGRLDYDSEGLVLLTDDAALQHRLADPRFKVAKTYLVQVEGIPTEDALARLRAGVVLQGTRTAPAGARHLLRDPMLWERSVPVRASGNRASSWLEIKLTQGMNRQVRRMTAAVGHPTLRLVRVAIGPLSVSGLGVGQYRALTERELRALAGQRRSGRPTTR